jgi:hypothetical protein
MNRKLTWLLAAACLLAAVLAQAGGKQEGSAGGGKPVTLRYSTWDYADRRDSTDAFIQGALETLNIKIELENYPTDQYENMVKTRISSGDAPDLINVHGVISGYGMKLAQAGAFADISRLQARNGYVASALAAGQLDGRSYFVSVTTSKNIHVEDAFLAEVNKALVGNSPTPFWHGFFTSQDINTELEKGFRAMLAGATTVDKLTATVQAMVAEKLAKK